MRAVGKIFEYFTQDGEKREAECIKEEFNKGLKKIMYIGVCPYGSTVRIAKDKVHKIL